MARHAVVLLALVVGCVAGSVASRRVDPPIHAQPGAARYEYICVQRTDAEGIQEYANKAGAAGWQMVTAGGPGNSIWCFRQSIQ